MTIPLLCLKPQSVRTVFYESNHLGSCFGVFDQWQCVDGGCLGSGKKTGFRPGGKTRTQKVGAVAGVPCRAGQPAPDIYHGYRAGSAQHFIGNHVQAGCCLAGIHRVTVGFRASYAGIFDDFCPGPCGASRPLRATANCASECPESCSELQNFHTSFPVTGSNPLNGSHSTDYCFRLCLSQKIEIVAPPFSPLALRSLVAGRALSLFLLHSSPPAASVWGHCGYTRHPSCFFQKR